MRNEPRSAGPGRGFRPARRGVWLLLIVGAVLVATAAVLLLLLLRQGQKELATLLVPEGRRAAQVYTTVDRALDEKAGTTAKAARTAGLRLPAEARGNPEGYLFPATYPIDEDATPTSMLGYMVDTANKRLGADRMSDGARHSGVTVYQAVVIASIVQAEADTPEDMGKVARVVYNRLAKGMPLQMDSTLNYALNRSTLDTTAADTRIDSPYNSYRRRGLPPTPIGNPGDQALHAAITPTPGDWLYFVTVAPGDTRFTASYEEHRRNVEEFNERRRGASGGG